VKIGQLFNASCSQTRENVLCALGKESPSDDGPHRYNRGDDDNGKEELAPRHAQRGHSKTGLIIPAVKLRFRIVHVLLTRRIGTSATSEGKPWDCVELGAIGLFGAMSYISVC
jgi:hypothetical protein